METKKFTCHTCKEDKISEGISTGYGVDMEGNKICFSCCGVQDAKALQDMHIGDKTTMYLSGLTLSNWPGTFKINLNRIQKGRHNIARTRTDFWFSYKGNKYHGTQYGENTEIAHIKRIRP